MGFARDKVRCGVCEEEADSGSLLEVEPEDLWLESMGGMKDERSQGEALDSCLEQWKELFCHEQITNMN